MKIFSLLAILCLLAVVATVYAADCDNIVHWSPDHLHTEDVSFSLCYKPDAALLPPQDGSTTTHNPITISSTDKIGLLLFNSMQQSGDVYKIAGNEQLYKDAIYRNRKLTCEYHVNNNPPAQFSRCAIDMDKETGDSGVICQLKNRATITLAADKGDVLHLKCQHFFTPQDEQFNTMELLVLNKDNQPFLQHTYLTALTVNPAGDGQLSAIDDKEREKFLQNFAKENQDIDIPRRYLNIQINHISTPKGKNATTPTTDDPTANTNNANAKPNNHMSKDYARAICAHLCGVLDEVRRCKCDLQHFTRASNGDTHTFTFPISSHQNMIHNPLWKHRHDKNKNSTLLERVQDHVNHEKNNNALVPDATQINDVSHNRTDVHHNNGGDDAIAKLVPITRELLLDILQNDKTVLKSTQRFIRDLFDLSGSSSSTTINVVDQF